MKLADIAPEHISFTYGDRSRYQHPSCRELFRKENLARLLSEVNSTGENALHIGVQLWISPAMELAITLEDLEQLQIRFLEARRPMRDDQEVDDAAERALFRELC